MLGSDDGGLQTERTILAWRRTTLTAACVTALSLRAWLLHRSPTHLMVLVLSAVLVGVVATGAYTRTRQSSGAIRTSSAWTLFAVTAAVFSTSTLILIA